jgi:nucleotide sugar dehydrogenase
MKKLAIIGYGYVGQAFAEMVKGHYDITVFDPAPAAKCEFPLHLSLNDCEDKFDLAVVCVPTPSRPDGGCNVAIVFDVIREVKADLILIKSTVPPGTTENLKSMTQKRIVFSPEYVGEGKYYMAPPHDFQTDMKKTPFLILGGDDADCNDVLDILVPVLGPSKHYHKCSSTDAELIKYMENTYFGVKISFAQEMYDICQAFGADWYKVWEGWALDTRVDRMHTAVFPQSRGFGGKCLPKDINALVVASSEAGFVPRFLLAALQKNAEVRPDEPIRAKIENPTNPS